METAEAIAPELQGTVRDIMVRDVRATLAHTPIVDVAKMMTQHNLRRVVVLDEYKRVVGIVSQRDIVRHCLLYEAQNPEAEVPATQVEVGLLTANRQPVTVLPEVPLIKAATVLATNRIGCLPVVDDKGSLCGILTVTDLLRHLTGSAYSNLDAVFKFYAPAAEARSRTPAYIRRMNGDIVIPLKCLKNVEKLAKIVQLGFDEVRGRILIKFVEDEDFDGAQKVIRDKEQIVIQASDFVSHFGLGGKANTFDVENLENGRYLVLTPRQPQGGTISSLRDTSRD